MPLCLQCPENDKREVKTRGLCAKCHRRACRQVDKKKTTWEMLEASGLSLPLSHKFPPYDLSRTDFEKLLTQHVDQSADCLFLRGRFPAYRMRTIEKLWEKKRGELMPGAPETDLSNGKNASGKLYHRPAALAFIAWLTMPKGHYGTAEDPRLDALAAAEHVGCSDITIVNNLADKAIPDWSRNYTRQIATWRLADLDDFKSKYVPDDSRISIRDAAAELQCSKDKVRLALRRTRENQNGRINPGLIIDAELSKQRTGKSGPHGDSLSRADFECVKKMIAEGKKQPGFKTANELADKVGGKDRAIRIEAKQHAKLWHELGMLPGETWISQTTRTSANKTKPETYTWQKMTYSEKEFLRLWNGPCSAKVGASHLAILLPRVGDRRPRAEIAEKMRKEGFTGRRLLRAMKLANVKTMPVSGLGQHPSRICERTDPKKETKPVDAKAAIAAFFKNGPALLQEYEKSLEQKRLPRYLATVEKAEFDLGFQSKHPRIKGARWICKIDGQEWPSKEEMSRILTATEQQPNGEQQAESVGNSHGRGARRKSKGGRTKGAVGKEAQKLYQRIRIAHVSEKNLSELARRFDTSRRTIDRALGKC